MCVSSGEWGGGRVERRRPHPGWTIQLCPLLSVQNTHLIVSAQYSANWNGRRAPVHEAGDQACSPVSCDGDVAHAEAKVGSRTAARSSAQGGRLVTASTALSIDDARMTHAIRAIVRRRPSVCSLIDLDRASCTRSELFALHRALGSH